MRSLFALSVLALALARPALAQPTPVDLVWSQPAGAAALAVAFSPDGQTVATGGVRLGGSTRGRVDVWSALSGTVVSGADVHPSAPGGFSPVRALAFRPDGGVLVAGHGIIQCDSVGCVGQNGGGQNGGVLTWSALSLSPLAGWADASSAVRGVAWQAGAVGRLAAATTGGPVRLLDAGTLAATGALTGHAGGTHAVATSPDGSLVASVGADEMLRVWDAATGALRYAVRHGTPTAGGLPVSVAFNADGTLIATGGQGRNVTARVWTAADGTPVHSFEVRVYGGPARAPVAFSPNGRYLLSGIAEEILYSTGETERLGGLWFWDLTTGERAALYVDESAPQADGVTAVALSTAHDHLVAYTLGGEVRMVRVALSLSEPVPAADAFTNVPTTLPQGSSYVAAAPGDADGDGDLDLLVIRGLGRFPDDYTPELYRNDGVDGAGTFVFTRVPFPAPTYPSATQGGQPRGETVSWADADNDGDLDALVLTSYGSTVYRNDGAGGFEDSGAALQPYEEFWTFGMAHPSSAAWADWDNDGDLDLAAPVTTGGGPWPANGQTHVWLYRNEPDPQTGAPAGHLVLADSTLFPRVQRDASLTWGDVENDGDLDLLYLSAAHDCATATPLGECLVLYENTGGVLAPRPIDFPAFQGGAADFGDFDLDGDLDILLVASVDNPDGPPFLLDRAVVYRNDGGTFVADTLQFPFSFDESFQTLTGGRWADYDSDGDMDLVVGANVNDYAGPNPDFGGVALVFANTGGAFTLRAAVPASERSGTMTWADFDGDGDLDFLPTGLRVENGLWVDFARLYRNDASTPNAPPSPPGGLSAAVAGPDAVTLSWAPGSDDHTPAEALTYSLRVSTLDGQDIVSPHARVGGGRLVAEPGNVSLNRSWTLRGLASGPYVWSVQAVDNAFNGGPFAEGGTFTLGIVGTDGGANGALAVLLLSPNPSAGAARASLTLPHAAHATVDVFDALGRRVARLAEADLAAGAHTWPLDAARLAPGAYTVRARLAASDGASTVLVGRLTVTR